MITRNDQYRSLIAYLRETERAVLADTVQSLKSNLMTGSALFAVYLVGGIWFCVNNGGVAWLAFFALMPLVLLVLLVAGSLINRTRMKPPTDDELYKIEAHKLLDSLRAMRRYNRLHRDMSEATLTILDEIARLRQEIFHLLEAPYWRNPHLSETYLRLRKQAMHAANQSVLDAVVQFRGNIPEVVRPRQWSDWIDESVSLLLKSGGRSHYTEPGFDAAFDIAQKLQELKFELQSISNEAANEPLDVSHLIPGSTIDVTMQEIRNLKKAEEELRQGL